MAVLLLEELRGHINNIGLVIVAFMPYLGRIQELACQTELKGGFSNKTMVLGGKYVTF